MGPRRKGKKADKTEEEEKETCDAPMDVQTETGAEEDVHGDVEMTNEEPAKDEPANEEDEEEEEDDEEDEDGEEEPAVDGTSPAHKKGKAKKVKLTPYQKRFGQVSESGGLELEDVDEEIDEKGETKITKDGELLGDRQFRVTTFTLPRHPTRHYILLVDIAKATGYKDSFSFLIKNEEFPRLVAMEPDRKKLIEMDLIPYQLKNRTIGLVTARSVFRSFGYRIIKKGRAVRDDYFVGDREEQSENMNRDLELKKGLDLSKVLGVEFNREPTSQIFSHFPYRKADVADRSTTNFAPFKAPTGLKHDNWTYQSMVSAADYNRKLNKTRPRLFWDPHTNIEQAPRISQPTVTLVEVSKKPRLDLDGAQVEADVNVVGQDRKNWEPVLPTQESRKYPLALSAGQRQFAVSIYPERFGHQAPVYNPPKAVAQPAAPKFEAQASTEDAEDSVDEGRQETRRGQRRRG